MLGDAMGPEAFDQMLAAFPATFADRPLSTRALLDVSSSAAGDDMTFFFDQWLNSAGVPEFSRDFVIYRRSDGYEVMGQIEQDLDLFRMPIEIQVETDGEPEFSTVWVSGPSSEMDLVTERKPRSIVLDPRMRLLRLSPEIRVKVHISRGEDLAEQGLFNDAIAEYQAAVDEDRLNSLAFFRMGEAYFELGNLQLAASLFREALNGSLDPIWVEVWSYINLGKIYDLRRDRERAVTEYQKAVNTRDDAYNAQAEARRLIEEPFQGGGQIF
jgi:tetratricopeptide (TPR) repeat protein